jgi:DNA replication protein DnaC
VLTAGEIMPQLLANITVDEAAIAERELRDAERALVIRNADRSKLWQNLTRQFGQRYAAATFDSFEIQHEAQRNVVDKLREYAGDIDVAIGAGRNVIIYGPPGTGKDHLLVALMKAAVANYHTVEWRDAQSLYGSFRDAIGADKPEAAIIDGMTRPNVLAISDPTPPLGELSDYQRSMLFRVVDRRYRDLRPTWVTINAADSAEAERKIAPNIIDRLAHGALVLRCNWPSYRRA